VKDLKKQLQLELKQILSDAGKLKKNALMESLKECRDWERESIYFTLRKLTKYLCSEQKYNKKELTYIRFHINKTRQMIGYIQNPETKPSLVKKGKETEKKTKLPVAKKEKETNKDAVKKAEVVEEDEEEEGSSDEEMSEGKEFDDETQANSEDSDDDNNE